MLIPRTFLILSRQVRRYSLNLNLQDSLQKKAMLNEMCILVDRSDKYIGEASKVDCHRVNDGDILLHRAFSVFLFNTQNELLLQKRSPYKITYPNHYTNTCCSHPLATIKEELDEEDAVGVKLAAKRRLIHELGISPDSIAPADFTYVTRILYKSLGDGVWGEHEVDYILILHKDLAIDPNPNEVSEVRYIGLNEFDNFLKNLKSPITPWFELLSHGLLQKWWKNLHCIDTIQDFKTISSFL